MEVRGEGATGCVVDAIPCYGINRKYPGRVVSKLYDKVRERDKDKLYYEQYVRLADPDGEMTVPILDSCVTRDLPARALKCRLVRGSAREEPFYPQNIMPYGGVTLDKGAKEIGRGEAFFKLVEPLFRLVQRFDKHYQCHFDVKPGNVLYDAATKRVRVIDYGMIRPQVEVYSAGGATWPKYPYYPPEIYVLTSILNGLSLYQASDNGRQQLSSYAVYPFFSAMRELYPYEEAESDYNDFVLDLKRNSLLWPPDYVNRVDVFGAGTCMLEAWPHLKWGSAKAKSSAAAFVRTLLCANPAKRPQPAAALRAYTALVKGF